MPSDINIGAFSAGVRYKMPHSPELDLVMKITHDGLDKTTTLGGSVLSNIRYVGTPVWGNGDKFVAPFGVGGTSENNYLDGAIRNGRREWELTFMHIGDSDLFSSNYSSGSYFEYGATGYDSDDIDNQNQFEYNMFNDNSFIAQVWNKTLGGALPFIFQPDSDNENPDQFCIAKFDMKSLEISQVAFKSYEISLKIKEVW